MLSGGEEFLIADEMGKFSTYDNPHKNREHEIFEDSSHESLFGDPRSIVSYMVKRRHLCKFLEARTLN